MQQPVTVIFIVSQVTVLGFGVAGSKVSLSLVRVWS